MVLTDNQKRIIQAVGGVLFLLGNISFYLAGLNSTEEPTTVVLVISEECLAYVTQYPIQMIPSDRCIREIKYLEYRINVLYKEIDNVESRNNALPLDDSVSQEVLP